MAVEEESYSEACAMLLNNGMDASGNVKTVSVSIGALKSGAWNADKAYNIVLVASQCLSKSLYTTRHTKVTTVHEAL